MKNKSTFKYIKAIFFSIKLYKNETPEAEGVKCTVLTTAVQALSLSRKTAAVAAVAQWYEEHRVVGVGRSSSSTDGPQQK